MNENNPNQQLEVQDADLAILKTWVREELFDEVKIVYNASELEVEKDLYWMFIKASKDKLLGLKGLPGEANKQLRKMYVNMLWREANKPKVNLVTDGISTRRSTVYTAMSNKFSGEKSMRSVRLHD